MDDDIMNNNVMNNNIMNNDATSLGNISNDSILASEANSKQTETTQSSYKRAHEMKAHLALKCKRRIVCSDISFSAFDSPYFENFTKLLNPEYNSPKRATLATSILDVEAANITLKIEKELLKSKNLMLCVDSWCSPLKHSIYAFVIMMDEKKQYIYSLRDFLMSSHMANFNAKRIREVIENVGPKKFVQCICHLPHARAILFNCQTVIKFLRNSYIAGATLNQEIISTFTVGRNLKSSTKTWWSTVLEQDPQIFNQASTVKELIEQLRDILHPVKWAVKNVEFRTTLLANMFVELVKMAITIKETSWMSIEIKKHEDHIKSLALKIHSISPHNAACERVFSIQGWYFRKRRTRLSLSRLEIITQMHSFLVENAKLELNYVDPNLYQEDFVSIFNKISSSIEDGTDLFSEEDLFSIQKETTEEPTEELIEDTKDLLEENLAGENSINLAIEIL
ncbi:857_t:CDS:2 [Cetraspora pellucida]|uniref:857_t:CDS:1 n=1 Tax=Cetraspora pellucida TaxID=1433469 RepID=A0A9N8VZU4_9GLOM|nr:857_t:CDS:2 [Cetraspora pellucida]